MVVCFFSQLNFWKIYVGAGDAMGEATKSSESEEGGHVGEQTVWKGGELGMLEHLSQI